MGQKDNYQVIVSNRAARMLVSQAGFLAKVNPSAAERLVSAFETAADSLGTMPRRFPWLSGDYIPYKKYRCLLLEKRYLLIFQVLDDCVYIEYVVDGRQDYSWLIRE